MMVFTSYLLHVFYDLDLDEMSFISNPKYLRSLSKKKSMDFVAQEYDSNHGVDDISTKNASESPNQVIREHRTICSTKHQT